MRHGGRRCRGGEKEGTPGGDSRYLLRKKPSRGRCLLFVCRRFIFAGSSQRKTMPALDVFVCVYEHTQVRGSVELELPVRFVQKKAGKNVRRSLTSTKLNRQISALQPNTAGAQSNTISSMICVAPLIIMLERSFMNSSQRIGGQIVIRQAK